MNRIAKFFMLSCGVMTCMFLSGCFNAPTTLNYKHADRYTMGGATITDSVRNIDINWIGGNVDVLTHNENTVSFSEISDTAQYLYSFQFSLYWILFPYQISETHS